MIKKYKSFLGESINMDDSIIRLEEHPNIADWYIKLYKTLGISSCVVENAHKKLKDCEQYEFVDIIVGYNEKNEPLGRALIWRNVEGIINTEGAFVDRIYVKGHGNPYLRKRNINEQRLVNKLTKEFEELVDNLDYARRFDSSQWDSRNNIKGSKNNKISYTFNKGANDLYLPFLETFFFGNIHENDNGSYYLEVNNYDTNSELVINECGYDVGSRI
ncbi:MAG: hypothetical protein ACOC3Z_02395 [Nanoarchaeota archaeon]